MTLDDYLLELKISQNQLARLLGIKSSAITKWRDKGYVPLNRIEDLKTLFEKFKTKFEGKEEDIKRAIESLSGKQIENQIYNIFDKFSFLEKVKRIAGNNCDYLFSENEKTEFGTIDIVVRDQKNNIQFLAFLIKRPQDVILSLNKIITIHFTWGRECPVEIFTSQESVAKKIESYFVNYKIRGITTHCLSTRDIKTL